MKYEQMLTNRLFEATVNQQANDQVGIVKI